MGRIYPSYLFTDHDPVIDWLATAIKDSGYSLRFIEEKSGVTGNTLRRWFNRKTKKPQFSTIAAVARCIGINAIPLRPRRIK